MYASVLASSKMMLCNDKNESYFVGKPVTVKQTGKGYLLNWKLDEKISQSYPYNSAVLFNNNGDILSTVRIVPVIIDETIGRLSLLIRGE